MFEKASGKKRFCLKLIVYSLPIALLLGIVFGVAIYSGEAMPMPLVVALQAANPSAIYRPASIENYLLYKQLMTAQRHPQVVLVGSSRAFEFRSGLATRNPAAFYNASGAGWRLPEIRFYLGSLDPAALPKVLLFYIDQPWFNPDYLVEGRFTGLNVDLVDLDGLWLSTRSTWQSIFLDRMGMSRLLSRTEPLYNTLALGMTAIASGQGFRSDGSFRISPEIFTPESIAGQAAEYEGLFQKRARMLQGGAVVAEGRMQSVEDILQFCQQHDIYVIGFSGPFLPSLYDQMAASGDYGYISLAVARLHILFERYGFAYFDFTDPHTLGLKDNQFLDGWHGSEFTDLQEYLAVLRQLPAVLGPYSDPAALQTIGDQAANPFIVFPPA